MKQLEYKNKTFYIPSTAKIKHVLHKDYMFYSVKTVPVYFFI